MNYRLSEKESTPAGPKEKKWQRAYLFVVLLLVGALCFGAGLLTNIWQSEGAVVVNVVPPPEKVEVAALPNQNTSPLSIPPQPSEKAGEAVLGATAETCLYVGSKNSDKYHIPSCSYAKRILPANLVCFSSLEEAEKRGYTAGCLK